MKKFLLILLVGMTLAVAATDAAEAACSISNTAMVFGSYDVLSSAPLDTTGSIVYRCGRRDRNISITLDRGGATSYAARRMLNGSTQLFYNLYRNAARTVIWGDGTEGTQFLFVRNPRNNRNIRVPIFGRIPARQNVGVGTYTNTITVTLNF